MYCHIVELYLMAKIKQNKSFGDAFLFKHFASGLAPNKVTDTVLGVYQYFL